MNRVKEHKALESLIRQYGLTVERRRKHYVVEDSKGNAVTTISHSPSDPHFARQTVRVLVSRGYLPVSAKNVKF
jgi:hypothetical protein